MSLHAQARTDYIYPIEEAFKSILTLETIPEFDSETESIRKKMCEMFSKIEESEGVKKYNKISYYPNGLCVWDTGSHNFKIFLDPWESKVKPKTKERKVNYHVLKDINLLWYIQLMDYIKIQPRVYKDEKTPLIETINSYKQYEKLTIEEKNVCGISEYKMKEKYNRVIYDFTSLFDTRMGYTQNQSRMFHFLSEQELELIKTALESKSYYRGDLYRYIESFDFNKQKRVSIDLSNYINEYNGFSRTEENALALYEQVKTIEDPKIIKVFQRMKVLPRKKQNNK